MSWIIILIEKKNLQCVYSTEILETPDIQFLFKRRTQHNKIIRFNNIIRMIGTNSVSSVYT